MQHRDKLDPELLRRVSKDCVGATVPCVSHRSDPGTLPLLAVAHEQRSLNGMPPASFMLGRTSSHIGDNRRSTLDELSSSDADVAGCDPGNRDDLAPVVHAASGGSV